MKKQGILFIVHKKWIYTGPKAVFIGALLLASTLVATLAGAQSPARSDSAVMAFLAAQHIPVTENNTLTLLKSGQEKFDALFDDIARARQHIHLEYFNIRNDSIANRLFELLAGKVSEGVEVRVIFDAFGNMSNNRPLKEKHLTSLREQGIEIEIFDPLCFPYFNHINHRDHRKIAVIDGRVGYTGGINVADYYLNGTPEIGEWRDMHVRIEGEAVDCLQEIFLAMWTLITGCDIDQGGYCNGAAVPAPDTATAIDTVTVIDTATSVRIAIVDRVPRKMSRQMRDTYIQSMNAAQSKIQIVNAYFIPGRAIKKALKAALVRGVTVEIMISKKSDVPFTPEGVFYVAHRLVKKGADVYVYNGGFHHSKVMTVDECFSAVGSVNFDARSFNHDYEVCAFIFDEQTAAELGAIFEDDKTRSTKMTPEDWQKRPVWKRFTGWLANLLSPLL
ncbi:MAG: cardiolipin synthase [Prevotellaceae bacterium]|jgi:cardiolipin synthase|nr:cardiolipin synthase [Prevotellaceae bacterium]